MRKIRASVQLLGFAALGICCSGAIDRHESGRPSAEPESAHKGASVPPLHARSSELCGNERDDNTDGAIDEGCACLTEGEQRPCAADGVSSAANTDGLQTCIAAREATFWSECIALPRSDAALDTPAAQAPIAEQPMPQPPAMPPLSTEPPSSGAPPGSASPPPQTPPPSDAPPSARCAQALDVVMLLDRSGSMNLPGGAARSRMAWLRDAALAFLERLHGAGGVGAQAMRPAAHCVGIVEFPIDTLRQGSYGKPPLADCAPKSALEMRIRGLNASGETPLVEALDFARRDMEGGHRSSPPARRVFVLLSDGLPSVPLTETHKAMFRAAADEIYTVALGRDADHALLTNLAKGDASTHVTRVEQAQDLTQAFIRISEDACTARAD